MRTVCRRQQAGGGRGDLDRDRGPVERDTGTAMLAAPLLSLPISFVTALVSLAIALLILRSPAGNRQSRRCFALLFGVFAVQAALVGLRFGYGLEVFAPFQRALPFAVGPLAYFGFRAMADPAALRNRAVRRHAGAAALAILACWLTPLALNPAALPPPIFDVADLLIAVSFVFYLALLVGLYRKGPDVFEAAGFEGVARTRAWLLAAILLLAGILVADGAIALDFALSSGRHAPGLIALGSAVIIPVFLAAAVLYPQRATPSSERRPTDPRSRADSDAGGEADRALVARVDELLAEKRLHRDPDLNLTRLARRLGVPARRVSEAVNGQHGQNVSQFVNRRRVREAAELLAGSDRPVAEIMEAVGFRTKSNFNREFRRVTGLNPGGYRRQQRTEARSSPKAAAK